MFNIGLESVLGMTINCLIIIYEKGVDKMNKFITYKTSSHIKICRIFALCETATIIGVDKEAREGEEKTVLTISVDRAEKELFSKAVNGKERLENEVFTKGKKMRKIRLNEYFDSQIEE